VLSMPGWLYGWRYRKKHVINGSTAGAVTDYQVRIRVHYGEGSDSGEDVYLNNPKYHIESGSWTVDGNTYSYRLKITVKENSGNNLTDYQVKIVIDTAWLVSKGYATSTGNEVRFTQSDGSTLLSFWRENSFNQSETVYWVKIPSLSANSSIDIYMYFDPDLTGVSDASDGEATFIFFDNFETWSGWVQYGDGQVSQDSTRKYDGSYSAHKTTANDPNGAYKAIGVTLGRDIALEFWVNRNSAYTGGHYDRVGLIDDNGNGYGWRFEHNNDMIGIDKRDSYSATELAEQSATDYMDKWVFARLIIKSDGTIIAEREVDGSLNGQVSIADNTYSSFTRVYIFGGYDYWVDQMRMRKYVSPEPTATPEPGTGKCRSDFGDVRFTSSDGVTLLDYWIEELVEGDYAVFWVEVDSIPASPDTKTIYIYYGKSDATSISNGENTFEFFDDFPGTSIDTSKWQYDTGSFTVSNGVARCTENAKQIRSIENIFGDVEVRVKWRFSSGGRGNICFRKSYDAVSGDRVRDPGYDINFRNPDADERLRKWPGGDNEPITLDSSSYTYTDNEWYVGFVRGYGSSISGQAAENATLLSATDTDFTSGEVGLGTDILVTPGTDYVEFDWIFVRKYVDPEPSHGEWGREERFYVVRSVRPRGGDLRSKIGFSRSLRVF